MGGLATLPLVSDRSGHTSLALYEESIYWYPTDPPFLNCMEATDIYKALSTKGSYLKALFLSIIFILLMFGEGHVLLPCLGRTILKSNQ